MAEPYRKSREELETDLAHQLEMLSATANRFNAGRQWVAKELAARLRLLLHDHKNKRWPSLLTQLRMKNLLFWDTAYKETLDQELPDNCIKGSQVHLGLVGVCAGEFIPYLDGVDGDARPIGRQLPFDVWWNAVVIRDARGQGFSRQSLVLLVADKDGGAHSDPTLPQDYAALTRQNSLGMRHVSFPDFGRELPKILHPVVDQEMADPVLPTIRQIAHEVLKTLWGRKYRKFWTNVPGFITGPGTLVIKRKKENKDSEDS